MTDAEFPYTPSGLVRDGKPVTDWPSIRIWVLERDEYLCQICRIRRATDVDHYWPRRLGGEDHIENLRAACGPCNKAKGGKVDLDKAGILDLRKGVVTLSQRISDMLTEIRAIGNEVAERTLAAGEQHEFELVFSHVREESIRMNEYVRNWKEVADRLFSHVDTWDQIAAKRMEAVKAKSDALELIAHYDGLFELRKLRPEAISPADAAEQLRFS